MPVSHVLTGILFILFTYTFIWVKSMNFFEDIKRTLITENAPQPFFSATLVDGSALFLEGVKSLKEYTPQKITTFLKKGELEITGEGLFIKKFFEGDLVICGKITQIRKV